MTASKICVRFISGDERHFDTEQGSTLLELKVFVAKELRRFAPEVSIFCAESGTALEGDERVDIPASVIAVIKTLVTDRDFWKRTFVAHGRGNDAGGVLRALEAINSSTNNDIRATECLTEVFMEQLEIDKYRLDEKEKEKRSHCIKACLQVGVDVHQRNLRGKTCLMLASAHDELDAVNQLLDDGAQVNVGCNNLWWSSLYYGCKAHSLAIVDRLLLARARVDHRDRSGNTALGLASRWSMTGSVEVGARILNAGAKKTQVVDRLLAAGATLGPYEGVLKIWTKGGEQRKKPDIYTTLL